MHQFNRELRVCLAPMTVESENLDSIIIITKDNVDLLLHCYLFGISILRSEWEDKAHNNTFIFMSHSIQNPGKSDDENQKPCHEWDTGCWMSRKNGIYLRQNSKGSDNSCDKSQFIKKGDIGWPALFFDTLFALQFMFEPQIMHIQ